MGPERGRVAVLQNDDKTEWYSAIVEDGMAYQVNGYAYRSAAERNAIHVAQTT
jgi:hypothetical protein